MELGVMGLGGKERARLWASTTFFVSTNKINQGHPYNHPPNSLAPVERDQREFCLTRLINLLDLKSFQEVRVSRYYAQFFMLVIVALLCTKDA